jgi:hypothetical protein
MEGDKGLVAQNKAAHHAISAPFPAPIDFKDKPLVVQYEVKYQKGGNCGGGYVKLLEDGFQTSGKEFSDNTPWVVMFGPDLTCPGTKACTIVNFQWRIALIFLTCFRCTSFSVTRTPLQACSRKNISKLHPGHLLRSCPISTPLSYSESCGISSKTFY